MKYKTNSEKETLTFAKKYAKNLQGGEIIGLVGDLGAGKTVFTKGLAVGFGIKKVITSPTFVLMKVYTIKGHKQIKYFVHIDAYRLKSAKDLDAIGASEYCNRADSVVIIEWADRVKKILPKETVFITIDHDKNGRIFNFSFE